MISNGAAKTRPARNRVLLAFAVACLALGIVLMAINIYGLTQPIRKPGLGVTDQDQLRFVPETVWSYEQSLVAIENLSGISGSDRLATEANRVVNQSLVHIKWDQVDPEEYRQLVPVWENYFLWAIGRFSGLPQFERYHYADYRRNIRRGIGICGDASTTMSSILDRYGVGNRIVSFDGHVIVEYEAENGERELADPDFGVLLGVSLDKLVNSEEQVRARYQAAGYSTREIDTLISAYNTEYAIFDDTYHFMSMRYLFERVSYVAKWVVPFCLIVFPLLWFVMSSRPGHHR